MPSKHGSASLPSLPALCAPCSRAASYIVAFSIVSPHRTGTKPHIATDRPCVSRCTRYPATPAYCNYHHPWCYRRPRRLFLLFCFAPLLCKSKGKVMSARVVLSMLPSQPTLFSPLFPRLPAPFSCLQKQGLKVGAFGKERIVYHHDYMVHEDLGFCRYLAPEFTPDAKPDEILLEFSVRPPCVCMPTRGGPVVVLYDTCTPFLLVRSRRFGAWFVDGSCFVAKCVVAANVYFDPLPNFTLRENSTKRDRTCVFRSSVP